MTIIKTPAHLLAPGDRIPPAVPGEPWFIVLCVAHLDPGPVGLQLGRLGELPAHLDRVATVSWAPMELVDVEAPGLTPAQEHADELLAMVRSVARGLAPHPDTARALVDKIAPPPPTLEEALIVLDKLCNDGAVGPQLNDAEKLLHRARVAGVLPRG